MHRICGRSSSGRAPPCQGGGSEFEPRRPLQTNSKEPVYAGFLLIMVTWPSGKARVCKTLIHQFKSGRHLQKFPEAAASGIFCFAFLFPVPVLQWGYYFCEGGRQSALEFQRISEYR